MPIKDCAPAERCGSVNDIHYDCSRAQHSIAAREDNRGALHRSPILCLPNRRILSLQRQRPAVDCNSSTGNGRASDQHAHAAPTGTLDVCSRTIRSENAVAVEPRAVPQLPQLRVARCLGHHRNGPPDKLYRRRLRYGGGAEEEGEGERVPAGGAHLRAVERHSAPPSNAQPFEEDRLAPPEQIRRRHRPAVHTHHRRSDVAAGGPVEASRVERPPLRCARHAHAEEADGAPQQRAGGHVDRSADAGPRNARRAQHRSRNVEKSVRQRAAADKEGGDRSPPAPLRSAAQHPNSAAGDGARRKGERECVGGCAADRRDVAPEQRDGGVDELGGQKLQPIHVPAASRPLRPDCAVGDDHLEAVVLRCGGVGAADEQRWVGAIGAQEG